MRAEGVRSREFRWKIGGISPMLDHVQAVTKLSRSKTRQKRRPRGPQVRRLLGRFFMRRTVALLSASLFTLTAGAASAQNATPHNLILFVPDGLRALKVTPE